jgi:hypothetical protein
MSVQRYSIQVPNQVEQESKLTRHLKLRKHPDDFRKYSDDFRIYLGEFRKYLDICLATIPTASSLRHDFLVITFIT